MAASPVTCTIPNVAGQTVAAATAAITAAGCGSVAAGSAPQDAIVTGTNPVAGSVVNVDSSISLVVETEPEPCDFGSLIGMARVAAVSAVRTSGCTASVVEVELEEGDVNIGLVVGHDPGPVAAGTVVEVRVGVAPTTTSTTGTTTTPTTGGSDPGDG